MKSKFIELYNNLFENVKVDVPISDIKELALKHNIDVVHFCIKNRNVSIVDAKPNIEKRYVVSEVLSLLNLVANKYPHLNVEFLHIDDDFPRDILYNLPVFGMACNPNKGVYNPVTFYEHINTIRMFEHRHVHQMSFNQKQNRVFGRYGISGMDGINKINWINHYKVQFALSSIMCPKLINIKFLFVPHDLKLYQKYIEDVIPTEIRDVILSLPIYDKNVTNLWNQTIDDAFESKICIFNEGNSISSPGRILTCLHNDGVTIKVGRNEFFSFLDLMIKSIDERLIYSYHEKPDHIFYKNINDCLNDNDYRITKNLIVNEFFNQNTILDLTYETLNLYRILSKQ